MFRAGLPAAFLIISVRNEVNIKATNNPPGERRAMRWSHGLCAQNPTSIFCKRDGGASLAGTAASLLVAWDIYICK